MEVCPQLRTTPKTALINLRNIIKMNGVRVPASIESARPFNMAQGKGVSEARIILQETERRSYRLIWMEEIQPRLSNARKSAEILSTHKPPGETECFPGNSQIEDPESAKITRQRHLTKASPFFGRDSALRRMKQICKERK